MIADYYDAHDEYEVSTNVNTIVLAKGANFALTATAKKNGVALDQTSILFTSSDTSIATVSSTGVGQGRGKWNVLDYGEGWNGEERNRDEGGNQREQGRYPFGSRRVGGCLRAINSPVSGCIYQRRKK